MAPPLLLDEAALRRPSFAVLYAVARSYLPAALRYLRVPPHEIGDFVHDIVLAAHESLNLRGRQLVPVAPGASSLQTLKAWLSGITWRQVRNRRRHGHQRFELPCGEWSDLPVLPADQAPSSEQLAADMQRCRVVGRVLERLSAKRAEILIMYVLLDMSVTEIAEELALNENTVKSRLGRARTDFVANTKRLSPEERGLLTGSAMLLPFGLEWPSAEEQPWTFQPSAGQGPGLGLVAGAMAALVPLALWSGAALLARAHHAPAPHIVAVREPGTVDSEAPPSASTLPAVPSAPPLGAPPTPPAAARSTATARGDDMLARERWWIGAARRALHEGAYDRVLAALDAHERHFPRGALVEDRERLRREAASGLAQREAP